MVEAWLRQARDSTSLEAGIVDPAEQRIAQAAGICSSERGVALLRVSPHELGDIPQIAVPARDDLESDQTSGSLFWLTALRST